jgi:hypothetical protein
VIHQRAAHRLRGDGEEVRAVLPVGGALVDQAEEGLVDQGRGLERVPAPLVAQERRGQSVKVLVDDREDPLDSAAVASGQFGEELGDLPWHEMGQTPGVPRAGPPRMSGIVRGNRQNPVPGRAGL